MQNQNVKEFKIEENDNITKFIEIVSQFSTLEIIYRGQHYRQDYQLIPTLGRLYRIFSENERVSFVWQKHRNGIMNEFKNKAIPYLEMVAKTEIEWQIYGQHHGLATQLLDWTFNPLAALFFSLESINNFQVNNEEYKIFKYVVYGIKGPIYDFHSMDKKDKEEYDNFYIIRPPAIDKRIIAQQSCFTFHLLPEELDRPFKPLNDIFSKDPYSNKEIYFLFKILIHEKCREEMLDELDSLGINRHTLFPDLDGLAKYIAWKNQRMGRLKRLSQDIMLKL